MPMEQKAPSLSDAFWTPKTKMGLVGAGAAWGGSISLTSTEGREPQGMARESHESVPPATGLPSVTEKVSLGMVPAGQAGSRPHRLAHHLLPRATSGMPSGCYFLKTQEAAFLRTLPTLPAQPGAWCCSKSLRSPAASWEERRQTVSSSKQRALMAAAGGGRMPREGEALRG